MTRAEDDTRMLTMAPSTGTGAGDWHPLVVVRSDADAGHVRIIELCDPAGAPLPVFEAGAHIVVDAGGRARAYSLINAPDERDRYRIAVKRERDGGGSGWMHANALPGVRLRVGRPGNHFALSPFAAQSLLFAGGIGITPLWAIVQRLERGARAWTLHYVARTRDEAPLLDTLEQFATTARHGRLESHFTRQGTAGRPDLAAYTAGLPSDAHVYACGPASLLEDVLRATAYRPPETVHVERFKASMPVPCSPREGFIVELARSGRQLEVMPGQTILDALEAAGVFVYSSCRVGICGICETAVLAGEPEHLDSVLEARQRQEGRSMMVCCSRSRSARLVLDL